MPRDWKSCADATEGLYDCYAFKQAMYQIVTQQCLYLRFKHQAISYRIISQFRAEFLEALDLMGLKLRFVDAQEFCFVVPTVAKYLPVDRNETLFMLVLRHIYHHHAMSGGRDLDDEVVVSLPELMSAYESLTGEELDKKANVIKNLIRSARRYGFAREVPALDDGDQQQFAIVILPGIAEVFSENAVGRVGARLKAGLLSQPESENDDINKDDASTNSSEE